MLREPFFWQGQHIAVDLPGARALFTTRRGGFSAGPYASLNLGRWTDDDPCAVAQNLNRLEAAIGRRVTYSRQVHGNLVRRVDERTRGAALGTPPDSATAVGDSPEADGLLTTLPGVAPLVLTADCLPVALAGGGAVAVLHAGWRGLAGGILPRGVQALRALVGQDEPLVAAVGPGASACCYEVSDAVHATFARQDAGLRRGANLDLPGIAVLQLERAGVTTSHAAGICTICSDPALFYSHRRDRGLTGRQAGVAWLT